MIYKTIDLCSGIGGIRRGFELAGNTVNVVSAEIDDWACKTYYSLFNENPKNDIQSHAFKKSLKSRQYDILLSGFPCQTFSSAGLKKGFEDTTKGTVFFDIATIIQETRPKVVFLENVKNLLSHNKHKTFKQIIDTLDKELNYHVIGAEYDQQGNLIDIHKKFLRNSKHFGIPHNRPRVYIVAFNRDYFGHHLSTLPNEIPKERIRNPIYKDLESILEKEVDARYFLSSGYLNTLEKHAQRHKEKGNGFGYKIVNIGHSKEMTANSLLATGGSGKERNLIYDPNNGRIHQGKLLKSKRTPINDKFIRVMTPNEWGRLQGFIGYAFVDENHNETFSFPDKTPESQKYKQLGNSVTIPVIEELAAFIFEQLGKMVNRFSCLEHEMYHLYGEEIVTGKKIVKCMKNIYDENTIYQMIAFLRANGLKKFSIEKMIDVTQLNFQEIESIITLLIKSGILKTSSTEWLTFTKNLH